MGRQIAVNQASCRNREIDHDGDQIAWAADIPDFSDKYLALFNVGDGAPAAIGVDFSLLGNKTSFEVRDLWAGRDLGRSSRGAFRRTLIPTRQNCTVYKYKIILAGSVRN